MRVLLTGGRAPGTLDLARHLAASGNDVLVAESQKCPIARWSNAVGKTLQIPPPRYEPVAFTRALAESLERERIDVLIPTCEEVFYVSRYADIFSKHSKVFCEKFSVLENLHNKWLFSQFGSLAGIDCPKTVLIKSQAAAKEIVASFEKCVLKPAFSRFAVHTKFDPTESDLESLKPTNVNPWICQERIEGTEFCTYSVARNGRLLAHSCYKPTYRAGRASGFYFEPQDIPAISAYVSAFLDRYQFSGQVGFDFIRDFSGRFFVLECNPRLTSGIHLFDRSSEFGQIFSEEWNGNVVLGDREPTMIGLAMVLMQFPRSVLMGNINRAYADFLRARDVVSRRGDLLPTFGQFVQIAECLVGAAAEGVSPIAASTQDIEWDGEPMRDVPIEPRATSSD